MHQDGTAAPLSSSDAVRSSLGGFSKTKALFGHVLSSSTF